MRTIVTGRRHLKSPAPHKLGALPLSGAAPLLVLSLAAMVLSRSRLVSWLAFLLSGQFSVGGFKRPNGFSVGGFKRPAGFAAVPGDIPSWVGYDTVSEAPSVANLSRSLTINGTTVQPTFWYKGQDASGTTWPAEVGGAAGLLTEAGSGASPSYAQGTPLMGSDAAVKYNNAKYHQAAGASFGDVTTGDLAIEAVLAIGPDTDVIFSKGTGGATDVSYRVICVGNILRLYVNDGDNNVLAYSGTVTTSAWTHMLVFVNRDEASTNGSRFYLNGAASGVGCDFSGSSGSISNAQKLTVGAMSDGANAVTGSVSQLALWQAPSWHAAGAAGPAEWATLAARRFRALTGCRPQSSTAGVDTAPITAARNCVATLEKYNSTTSAVELYTVGENWPRVERWLVGSSTVMGIRHELAATNKFIQSENMATTWTKLDAGDTIAATTFIADSTDGDHGVSQAVTVTAASWVVMVEATKGNKNWLYISDDTVANCTGYFDLNTPAAGTFGAGATGGIINRGDRVLCWMTLTGTAAAHTFKIQTADADGDKSIVGDGAAVNTTIHRAQLELGTYPTSYIATTTAAVTRVKDELEYTVVHPGAQGAICFDVAQASSSPAALSVLVDLSDGTTNRAAYRRATAANGNVGRALVGSTGDVLGTTKLSDGTLRRVGMRWQEGRLENWVNGVMEGTPDTTVTAPTAFNQIAIGMKYDNTAQPGVPTLLRNIRVYDRYPANMAGLTT